MKIRYKNPPKKILIVERRKSDEINKKRRKQINNFKQRGAIMTSEIKKYLVKEINDSSGNTANFHLLKAENVQLNENDGSFSIKNFQFAVYKNQEAFLDGKALVDNLISRRGIITVADSEIKLETGATIGEQLAKAFLRKATASVLDENGEESNLFDGRIKGVDFIGISVE